MPSLMGQKALMGGDPLPEAQVKAPVKFKKNNEPQATQIINTEVTVIKKEYHYLRKIDKKRIQLF